MTALRNFILSFDKTGLKEKISMFAFFDGGYILTDDNKKRETILTERIF